MKKLPALLVCAFIILSASFIAFAAEAGDPAREEFSDAFYGFRIKGPAGWVKEEVPTAKEIVRFRKNASREKEKFFPDLSVCIDVVPGNIKNSVDFSRFVITSWRVMLARNDDVKINVIEEPHEVQVNGLNASRCVYDLISKDGKTTRNIDYKFLKGSTVISVQAFDLPTDAHLKEFDEGVQSFEFINNG